MAFQSSYISTRKTLLENGDLITYCSSVVECRMKKQFGESFFKNDDFPIIGWQIVTYMSNCYLFLYLSAAWHSSRSRYFELATQYIYPSRDFMRAFTRVEKLPSGWNYFFIFRAMPLLLFVNLFGVARIHHQRIYF